MAHRRVRKMVQGRCWHAWCDCGWSLCAKSWRTAFGYALKHVCGFR